MFNKSEQNRSDKARKTGKLLRHGEQIRQIVQTWRENQALIKCISREERTSRTSFAHASPTKNGPGENPGPLLQLAASVRRIVASTCQRLHVQRMLQVSSKPYRRNQTRG